MVMSILSYTYAREQYEDQIQGRLGNLLYEKDILFYDKVILKKIKKL